MSRRKGTNRATGVPVTKQAGVRDRILEAAVSLLRAEGTGRIAQPQVARAAGVPQGHLTYYFPRRRDLIQAVAERTLDEVAANFSAFRASGAWPGQEAPIAERTLALAMFAANDDNRMRMFIRLLVEAEEEPSLRAVMAQHSAMLRGLVGEGLGRAPDDPDVDLMVAALLGLALRHLVFGDGERPTHSVASRIALLLSAGKSAR